MKRYVQAIACFAIAAGFAQAAEALDICSVHVSRSVRSDNGDRVAVGTVRPVTSYFIDPDTKRSAFCAEGGSCIPEFVTIRGRSVRATTLRHCSIDRSKESNGFYRLIPIAGDVPAGKIAQASLEDRLRDAGVAHALAEGTADEAIRHPRSAIAGLVRQALGGSQKAIDTLNDPNTLDNTR